MFKKPAWRTTVSNAVSFHQDQALNTTIFLLKSYGPTGFLLREDGESRNFKVYLGDPHTCTCPVFTKDQEPCKHICWILLRKFRLPREHEYSFQHGLAERQILELLNGSHQAKAHQTETHVSSASGASSQTAMSQEDGSVCRKIIEAQDVCPICQEELLEKKLPVTYCRFGCGNSIHISCMKVWADHQKLSDSQDMVKCPLCREPFSSLKSLHVRVRNAAKLFTVAEREKPDRHMGVSCQSCRVCPVVGKCFKCTVCSYYHLCEDCAHKRCHPQHRLALRTKRREKWSLVEEDVTDEPKGVTSHPGDASINAAAEDPLPEHVLKSLPSVRVRSGSHLLDDGQQCRLCLQKFSLGQKVRTLPCHHKFHMACVDGILCKLNFCPLDGYVIYNPLTWTLCERKLSTKSDSCLSGDCVKQPENNLKDLFIPGVALQARNPKTAPSHGSLNLKVLTSSSGALMTNQLHGLCVTSTDAVAKEGKAVVQKNLNHMFPEICSVNNSHKSDSADRQNACSSKKIPATCTSATPNLFVTVTKIEQPQVKRCVGSSRAEADCYKAEASFPQRRTRPPPRTRSTDTIQVTNTKPSPQLTMTGVPLNTQH